jgi:hypothetical protein
MRSVLLTDACLLLRRMRPQARRGCGSPFFTRMGPLLLAGIGLTLIATPNSAGALGRATDEHRPGSTRTVKHEVREVSGLVLAVEPSELTIQSKSGQTVRLTTFEDYTNIVPMGAEVKASYYPQDSGQAVLKSLDVPPERLFVPQGQLEQSVHRVVILARYTVPDADGFSDALRNYLNTNLGWYVAPQYLADELRNQSEDAGSTLDAVDPATGDFDMKRYLAHSQGVVERMAAETRSDAVLEVDLVAVDAPVSRMVASWDGVEEPVAGEGTRTLARLSMFSHRGEVRAATAELKLWDAHGKLLWRNRRGLCLLQVLEGHGKLLRERPLSDYLADTQQVQAWMSAAFKLFAPVAPSGTRRAP